MPEEPPTEPDSTEDETMVATPSTGGGSILPAGAAPLREVIGDYEILAKLGSGGMGAVYRARQLSLGRVVALKVLPAHLMQAEDSVARFQREARVAASVSHPNLVHIFAAGEADGCHFIAMELVEGEDLWRRLKRDGALPAPEALRICAAVARGLDHAWHTAHLIHRDIKPANIFLAADGRVKIGDLGLAKSVLGNTTGLTQTGLMMGTPHYISPEQARADKEIDFRTDIYSLGCTLFHMLTGRMPYAGTDAVSLLHQHIHAPLPAILKAWPQCPVPLARLVGRMLKKSRHERPASYAELISQIETVWAQIDPLSFNPEAFAPPQANEPAEVADDAARPPSTPPTAATGATPQPSPIPTARSELPLYSALAIAVLLLILGGVFFLLPREEKLTQAEQYVQQKEREAAKRAARGLPADDVAPATETPPPMQTAAASPAPTPEWRKVAFTGQQLRGSQATLGPEGELIVRGDFLIPGIEARNVAMRAEMKKMPGFTFGLKVRHGARGWRQIAPHPTYASLQIHRSEKAEFSTLTKIDYPNNPEPSEAWVPVEFAVIGETSYGQVRGMTIPPGHSSEFTEAGQIRVSGSGRVRNMEVLLLDGVPEDEALKLLEAAPLQASRGFSDVESVPPNQTTPSATATKDAPFVNSLGMQFVPVPITGGPTGGQRVLFSIWETRVQDFEAFASETKVTRRWKDNGIKQGPTHPAVTVSWDDAQAFCTWLTERERKTGNLGANEVYRLPSDHEWSCAVGIGEQEDAAKSPQEKDGKVADVFPWGSAWPPPVGAGNFWSEEMRPLMAATHIRGELPGYRDGFGETAPAGSFPANRFGLHDVGSNVTEWCEDWYDSKKVNRVLRGAAWVNFDRGSLIAARRGQSRPETLWYNYGFRVVLAPVP